MFCQSFFDVKDCCVYGGKVINRKIAIAGTGYVWLFIATLLAQHNVVKAVDIVPEKVDLINQKKVRFRMITLRSILRRKS